MIIRPHYMKMLRDDLKSDGVPDDHIIFARYTSEDMEEGMTDKAMYQAIKGKMTDDERYYILLDEVQEIGG